MTDAATAEAPAPILKAVVVAAGEGDTRQPPPEREDQTSGGAADYVAPPLDPGLMAKWSEINGTRDSIIEAIARNTVGLGFTIEVPDDAAPTDTPADTAALAEQSREITVVLNALARRDTRLGRPDFTELLMAVKTDEEETGSGYLEVSRSKITNRIDGLFHLPAKRMRRRKDRKGWLQLNADGTEGTQYLDFGDKVEYDEDGTPSEQQGDVSALNEVLVFRLYTSESRDYGMPRDSSLAIEYLGDKAAAEDTAAYFQSGGTPPTVIFVQGEENRQGERLVVEVPPQTVTAITDTLRADAGVKKRVAIVPLPAGVKATDVKLGEVNPKDVGHNEFRQAIARRTLSKFRVAPIFLSDIDGSGRYSAEVQRALTLEQVFDPEQKRYESRLRETVLRDLGYADRTIKFVRLAVESDQARREAADQLATVGDITNREHRRAHGYGPLPEVQLGDELPDGRKVVEHVDPPPPIAPIDPAPAPAAKPSSGPVAKTDPAKPAKSRPAPAPGDPSPQDPATAPAPEKPTEVALANVTMEEAALIGKVPAGWNDQLVSPVRQTANQPFGGATDGSDVPHGDQRGLRPGLAGRQQQTEPVAKHEGERHVEAQVDALRDELEGLSDRAVDRALARTRTLANGIAVGVAEILDERGRVIGTVE